VRDQYNLAKNVRDQFFSQYKFLLCGEAEEYSSMRVSRDERENFARAVEGMRVTCVSFFLFLSVCVIYGF